ncbi:MAG: hypothetical protein M1830_000613, partial [Pleopsidium flavum]
LATAGISTAFAATPAVLFSTLTRISYFSAMAHLFATIVHIAVARAVTRLKTLPSSPATKRFVRVASDVGIANARSITLDTLGHLRGYFAWSVTNR